jgi:hypothetical protein
MRRSDLLDILLLRPESQNPTLGVSSIISKWVSGLKLETSQRG